MTIEELQIAIQLAEDVGVTRVAINESRDGQQSYPTISNARIVKIGDQNSGFEYILVLN